MVKKSRALHAFTGRRSLADLQRFLTAKYGEANGVEYDHRITRRFLEELEVPLYPRRAGTWKWFYIAVLRDQSPPLAEQFDAWLAERASAALAAAAPVVAA